MTSAALQADIRSGVGGAAHHDDATLPAKSTFIVLSGLFLLALAVRLASSSTRMIQHDELYHVLAASSWVKYGTLAIGTGEYTRVGLYTVLTGLSVSLFGDSMTAARLPAIVAGALQIPLLFAWTYARAGAIAAWIAALMLCFSQFAVATSQFARFYTVQALAVWVFAVCCYSLLVERSSPTKRVLLCIGAVTALAIAGYVQKSSAIVLLAVAAWAALHVMYTRSRLGRRIVTFREVSLVLVGAVAIGCALLIPQVQNAANGAVREFFQASEWALPNKDVKSFYIRFLATILGPLFYTLPFGILLAWKINSRATLFCASIAIISIAAHSLAAIKSDRYIYYTMPFIFAVWGIAASALYGLIQPRLARLGHTGSARSRLAVAGPLLLLLGLMALTDDFRATIASNIRNLQTGHPERPRQLRGVNFGWDPFVPLLRRLTDVPMFVTASDVRALYYLGGYDLLLNRTIQLDIRDGMLIRDPRTGGPVISSGRAIGAVMRCYREGVVLVPEGYWRTANVTPEAADVIERLATRENLPPELPIRLYHWRSPRTAMPPQCTELVQKIGYKDRSLPRLVHMR